VSSVNAQNGDQPSMKHEDENDDDDDDEGIVFTVPEHVKANNGRRK
jgi:hypothetical protein